MFRLRSGAVRTLAYEPNGRDRFVRVVGPLASREGGEAWLAGADINPACRAALVAAEDFRFHRHLGVDRLALASALQRNLASRRIVWGGSTITQQLAKNAFLDREKSYLRKARELLGALLLDRIVSKRDQVTWYLNAAEFGPRVYGLEAAAQHYFGHAARELRLAQCVALFAILPDPIARHSALLSGRASRTSVARWTAALRALALARALPAAEIASARDELFRGAYVAPAPLAAAPRFSPRRRAARGSCCRAIRAAPRARPDNPPGARGSAVPPAA
ncbi:MAG: biosynthetic peptidoglycan transglycosylase [Myxococcota bacterium]